jgi:hypothetical protein
MFRMKNDVIVQTNDAVMARADVIAQDRRSGARVNMTIFCELTAEEQDVKPIAERALKIMGYNYLGIDNVETTTYPQNAEEMFNYGKSLEM